MRTVAIIVWGVVATLLAFILAFVLLVEPVRALVLLYLGDLVNNMGALILGGLVLVPLLLLMARIINRGGADGHSAADPIGADATVYESSGGHSGAGAEAASAASGIEATVIDSGGDYYGDSGGDYGGYGY
ncbi:MAG: hypothetical protein HYU64_20955 [Armatimonadetes bacterium]|nr:hypothetical protein [Armatimonadota bacterium]